MLCIALVPGPPGWDKGGDSAPYAVAGRQPFFLSRPMAGAASTTTRPWGPDSLLREGEEDENGEGAVVLRGSEDELSLRRY